MKTASISVEVGFISMLYNAARHSAISKQTSALHSTLYSPTRHKLELLEVIAVEVISSCDTCTGLYCSWIRPISAIAKGCLTGITLSPQLFPLFLFSLSISCPLNPSIAQPAIYVLLCRREGEGLEHV